MRVLVIVPAYNESSNIGAVVAEVRRYQPEATILVVDDGSTDETALVARRAGARVLRLPFNMGIGATVQCGFLYAAKHRFDVALQVDGDGQHPPSEIDTLVRRLSRGDCDVVIGSRFMKTNSYKASWPRRMGIAIFALVNSILVRQRITDNTSGFRAYSSEAIRFLTENYPHDYPEPESVITLSRAGFRIVEVPVIMRVRQGGVSSITLFRSVYYMAKVLLAIMIGATRTRPSRSAHELTDSAGVDPRKSLHPPAGDAADPQTPAP